MEQQIVNNIRLLVNDEQSLYTPFSPDDELSEPVKSYIRSKVIGHDYRQEIKLTVISSSPLDEEKFKSAIANWIEDERAVFEQNEKQSTTLTSAIFIIGVSIIILLSLLKQHLEPLTAAIILIIGTGLTAKGVQRWYEQVTTFKAKKWLTAEKGKKSTIVFEYK